MKMFKKIIAVATIAVPLAMSSTASLAKDIVDTAINSGYNVILWSWHQETKDWSRPGAAKITQNVISDTRPGDVIIFHDAGGERSQTVKAVEDILEILYKNGYQCTTVSDLLYRSNSLLPAPLR